MPKRTSSDKPAGSSSKKIGVRQLADGGWELTHPRCASARADDLAEVKQMIAAEENEIARDELRWLLAECHDFIAAHRMLGNLALIENDLRLARGHFGYAYQLGLAAIEQGELRTLTYARDANRDFFDAGKSLAECLIKMGKGGMARGVIKRLLDLDPGDPLELQKLSSAAGHREGRGSGAKRRRRRR